jgi:hypothetical protein
MAEALTIAREFGPWVALVAVLVWTLLRDRTADRAELREVKLAWTADLKATLPALQASTEATRASRESSEETRRSLDAMADRMASLERDVERMQDRDRSSTDPGSPPSRGRR